MKPTRVYSPLDYFMGIPGNCDHKCYPTSVIKSYSPVCESHVLTALNVRTVVRKYFFSLLGGKEKRSDFHIVTWKVPGTTNVHGDMFFLDKCSSQHYVVL